MCVNTHTYMATMYYIDNKLYLLENNANTTWKPSLRPK